MNRKALILAALIAAPLQAQEVSPEAAPPFLEHEPEFLHVQSHEMGKLFCQDMSFGEGVEPELRQAYCLPASTWALFYIHKDIAWTPQEWLELMRDGKTSNGYTK